MAARSDELRVTLLGLALLGLLLLSHHAAPVDAAGSGGSRKNSFSMNSGAGARHIHSFSMNKIEQDHRGGRNGGGGH